MNHDTRRHHYVPAFVLRRFEANGVVRVLNLRGGPIFERRAEKILFSNGFYDAPVPGADDSLWLEHALGEIESAAAPLLLRLERGEPAMSPAEQDVVRSLIAVALIRNPATRASVLRSWQAIVDEPPCRETLRGWYEVAGVDVPADEVLDDQVASVVSDRTRFAPSVLMHTALVPALQWMKFQGLDRHSLLRVEFAAAVLAVGDAGAVRSSWACAAGGRAAAQSVLMPIAPQVLLVLAAPSEAAQWQWPGNDALAEHANGRMAEESVQSVVWQPGSVVPGLPPAARNQAR